MDKIYEIQYSDGNNNEYRVQKNKNIYSIEYLPVKPENSSSGDYSGGEEKKNSVSEKEFESLTEIILKLIKSENFAERRSMGTGLLIIKSKNSKKSYIFEYNSSEQEIIENKLKELLQL